MGTNIEKIIQRQKEKELSDFRALLQEAHRWQQAKMMRDYISEVEAKAIANSKVSEELKSWLVWARKKADWLDPTMKTEDELLKNMDTNSL